MSLDKADNLGSQTFESLVSEMPPSQEFEWHFQGETDISDWHYVLRMRITATPPEKKWSTWQGIGGQFTPPPNPNKPGIRIPGGHSAADGPGAVVFADGHTDVYARGVDDALWQQYYDPSSGWSGWFRHDDGGILGSSPTVVANGPGHRDVYIRGLDDGAVYHKWWTGSWSAWESLGGEIKGVPAAVVFPSGYTDLYVHGMDGALWQQYYDPSGGWSGWLRHDDGGVVASSPTVVANGPGHRDVYAVSLDGGMHHKSWS